MKYFDLFQARSQQQPTIQQSITRRSTRAPTTITYDIDSD